MKRIILSLAIATTTVVAQTTPPAAPAAPATPAAPGAAPAAPATPEAKPAAPEAKPGDPVAPATPPAGETKPGEKPAKVKPLSSGDQKFSKKAAEILQYQIKLAERAKGMKEKDATLGDWGAAKHKQFVDKWTPFATLVQKHGFTDIANDITKKETAEMAKLNKAKDAKFRQEYFELYGKEAKSAARELEDAPKEVQNEELKKWAGDIAKLVKDTAEELETKLKEEKKRK